MGSKGPSAAENAAKERERRLRELSMPGLDELRLDLEAPELQYLPEHRETARELADSRMEDVAADPRLVASQMKALEQLAAIGEEGLTDIERAQLNQMRRSAAGETQARMGAIEQDLASRGVLGSGQELALKTMAAQDQADRSSQEYDRLAAMAQERALSALAQEGNLATGLRQQDVGEQTQAAQAADAISKFNQQNAQEINRRNIERENQQLRLQQQYMDEATKLRNEQQDRNKALLVDDYNRRLQLEGAASQAAMAAAQAADERRAARDRQTGAIIGGVGTIAGGVTGGPAGAAIGSQVGNIAAGNAGGGMQFSSDMFKSKAQPKKKEKYDPDFDENSYVWK